MEKRYKLNPDPPDLPMEAEPVVESVLPIPREHPDVLLHTPDFEPKVGFLRTIGLDIMPPNRRDGKRLSVSFVGLRRFRDSSKLKQSFVQFPEAEVTWQYVLQDRKKRKSTNTVTAYCERIAKVYSKSPPALPKPPQKMRLLDRVKVKHVPERPPPLPPLVPNIVSMRYPALPMPGENGVKQHCKVVDIKIVDDSVDENVGGKKERPKWSGIEDIMLMYREYSKGTAYSLLSSFRSLQAFKMHRSIFLIVSCCRESVGEENPVERNIEAGSAVEQLAFRDHSAGTKDIRTLIRQNGS